MTQGELIRGALDEVVQAIIASQIPATRDSGDFQPPGAIVGMPTFTGAATLQSLAMTVPITLVTPEPGQAGVDWLLDAAGVLLADFGSGVAEPTIWTSPINPAGLPACLISLQMNVAQEGV